MSAPDEAKTEANLPYGCVAITRAYLKTFCLAKGFLTPDDTPANQRVKLSNVINDLAGKHLIGASGGYVWDARN